MNKRFSRVLAFCKEEAVLSIAALLAVVSMFLIPPSAAYVEYLDFRVLALLFCLMLVVSGLQSVGLFQYLCIRLLKGLSSTRWLALTLVLLCFFSSMLITNDVALITFVPFAVLVLTMAGERKLFIPVIVLQTIAANLGSMFTPIGNPQNLYLYSAFDLPAGEFFRMLFPLTALSLVLLLAAVLRLESRPLTLGGLKPVPAPEPRKLFCYLALFFVCLLCVARVIQWPVMLFLVLAFFLATDRGLLRTADYFLLLTFVCFFLFIGNMQRIPAVSSLLSRLISGRELLLGLLFSQVISNVPAAILLSGFTGQVRPLLYGVNIGGLGTLIASLASVISYRAYKNTEDADTGRYLKVFTVYNLLFLLPLAVLAAILLKL